MIYLLYGIESYLINDFIKKIKEENKINDLNLVTYDMENDNISNIIEDANTLTMFGGKKFILVKNSIFFTSIKNNIDISPLENYIKNINPNTIIVFTVQYEKLDERKKIYKTLKKIGIVKCFNETDNNFIKKMFEDYQIDFKLIQLLKERVGTNSQLLSQEIKKIITYKDNDKIITEEDILNLTNKQIDTDIFTLIDCIIIKDKEKAIEIYNEMIKLNEEPIKIIVMLANQFRIMYQSKILQKKGYSSNDIASLLEIHPYRVKLALEKSSKYKDDDLIFNLYRLAELDEKIKLGNIEKYLALELFLLKI
ncbi:MAG: DNA polymerase III subunit delta [Clostridium sp.]|nr:DNA polymerase III subunit delta [Clostridium sp.]MCM1444007.1 DNA polymerase III subunit delta [Candidatus Amulumruptor caecigallinarius]